jgi:mRNA-degrading endonuclease RelE of RelBE toxin-antitoxin system
MVISQIVWSDKFKKEVSKIKDGNLKQRLQSQIQKIAECPEIGKPLRYDLKNERNIYVKPYRLIYAYQGTIFYLLRFEHRKQVYR